MGYISVIFTALALAMDAFAVSVASGAAHKNSGTNQSLKMALAFGIFQALMPVIGYLAGAAARDFIHQIEHWIAFALLSAVGTQMIWESLKTREEEKKGELTWKLLLTLATATSIDALAVGVTFSLLPDTPLLNAVAIIGLVTFALSLAGYYIGRKIGHFFEASLEALGGVIIILIGLKILISHYLAALT